MIRQYIPWGAALALLLLGACQREEAPVECEKPGTGVADTEIKHIPTGFKVVLPLSSSKTAVNMASGTITWLDDDPVLISDGTDAVTMYVEKGGTTEAALYSRDKVLEGFSFYALYPAQNASYSADVFNLAIPTAQTYVKGGFASETFPMVAICGRERRLQFRNAASLLKVETHSSSLTEGLSIIGLELTADEPMTGSIMVNYSQGSEPMVDCSGGEPRVSVISPAEGIPFGEPVYFVVAPGDYSELTARLTLSNGLVYSCLPDRQNLSIDRSAYTTISVSVDDTYTDLSAGGSANCYMITEGGSYKFKANVRGNGVTTSCGLPAAIDGVSSAKLYYSDGAPFIDGNFVVIGDYICFSTVSGVLPSGTALVSALDSEGRTLWSWHIWSNPSIADVALSDGSVWLNMNLGAHQLEFNAEGYNGYYYQWGRKDPFLQKYTTSTAAKILAPFVSHASLTDGSLENSIANPHIFYGGFHPSGVSNTTEDWSSYEDDDKVYDWWNANITSDGQTAVPAAKTMFDPCPPGYHVPVYSEIKSLLDMAAADVKSNSGGRTVEGKLFFPYTSYRYMNLYADWWPGGKEASRIFIPSATPYETTTKFHRRLYRMYMTSSPSQGMSNGPRSYGLPVRCIKDGSYVPQLNNSFDSDLEGMSPEIW